MVIKKLLYLIYCHSSLPDEVVVIISVFFAGRRPHIHSALPYLLELFVYMTFSFIDLVRMEFLADFGV